MTQYSYDPTHSHWICPTLWTQNQITIIYFFSRTNNTNENNIGSIIQTSYFYSLWTLNNALSNLHFAGCLHITRTRHFPPKTDSGWHHHPTSRSGSSSSGGRLTFILSPLLYFGFLCRNSKQRLLGLQISTFSIQIALSGIHFLENLEGGGNRETGTFRVHSFPFLAAFFPGGSGVTVDIVCTCLLSSESHKGFPLIPVAQNPLSTVIPLMI